MDVVSSKWRMMAMLLEFQRKAFSKISLLRHMCSFGDHVDSNQRANLDGRLERNTPSRNLNSNIHMWAESSRQADRHSNGFVAESDVMSICGLECTNQLGPVEEGLTPGSKGVTDLALVVETGASRGIAALYVDVVKCGVENPLSGHEYVNVDKPGVSKSPCNAAGPNAGIGGGDGPRGDRGKQMVTGS
ncbi:hypothetical protein U1Q18_000121 [Sarracenia purpurea var. burkii]